MCGLAGGQAHEDVIVAGLDAQLHRGPDGYGIMDAGPWNLGHVRLAIQDTTEESAQPWRFADGWTLTFAGEMWNTPQLRATTDTWVTQQGDLEPLAWLLRSEGVACLPTLQGMFAIAWSDGQDLWLARDAVGEMPLHWGRRPDGTPVYATELGGILAMGAIPSTVQWVQPGTWMRFPADMSWMEDPETVQWSPDPTEDYLDQPLAQTSADLRALLTRGVNDRLIRDPDVSLACLVSGGVDSSSVLALTLAAGLQPECYTAVYDEQSTDLRHARLLADHFSVKLHEVKIPTPDQAALRRAVQATEMPHKAQIEIALACLHLAEAIAGDGHKIVLSGEGSDELWASYGFSWHGVQREGWLGYRWRVYRGQHRKNFARTNKVFMRHGVEPRLPFLHVPLARYAMRLDEPTVRGTKPGVKKHEKAALANAVDGIVPSMFAWQQKAAFQTKAGLDQAAASVVENPKAFYAETFKTTFGGVKP